MRKTLLVFLAVLFATPILSGCFYPYYIDDYHGRGYRQHRGYYYDGGRYQDGYYRDGYRDYRYRR